MSSYTISNTQLNPNRVFILQKSEIEKRLAPFYYVPELLELERKVLAKRPTSQIFATNEEQGQTWLCFAEQGKN